jgi:hypothetical protein
VLVEATADVEREVSTYAGDDGTHDCWCGVVSSVAGVWMWCGERARLASRLVLVCKVCWLWNEVQTHGSALAL